MCGIIQHCGNINSLVLYCAGKTVHESAESGYYINVFLCCALSALGVDNLFGNAVNFGLDITASNIPQNP